MIHFRAPLLGGVCSIGLMFQLASVDIVHATTTVEMPSAHDAALMPSAESAMPALADEAAINFGYETDEDAIEVAEDESAPPATGGQATTDYYGDSATSENPAWDAPAKMNPDYATDESAAPAATDTGAQAAPSEGDTSSEAAPPTQTAEEAAPPPTGGQATTDYYGGSETPSNPAWAAPAKMNPDYTNEPAAPAETAQPAAAETPAPAPTFAPAGHRGQNPSSPYAPCITRLLVALALDSIEHEATILNMSFGVKYKVESFHHILMRRTAACIFPEPKRDIEAA